MPEAFSCLCVCVCVYVYVQVLVDVDVCLLCASVYVCVYVCVCVCVCMPLCVREQQLLWVIGGSGFSCQPVFSARAWKNNGQTLSLCLLV